RAGRPAFPTRRSSDLPDREGVGLHPEPAADQVMPQFVHCDERAEHQQEAGDPHPDGYAFEHQGTVSQTVSSIAAATARAARSTEDRKSTRLNSSHVKL